MTGKLKICNFGKNMLQIFYVTTLFAAIYLILGFCGFYEQWFANGPAGITVEKKYWLIRLCMPKAIILSMTKQERSHPEIINPSRKKRIADGAGVPISEVNKLIKQFEQSRKMMKQMSGMMGGKRRGGFKLPFGF